jgi:hypothetical protein
MKKLHTLRNLQDEIRNPGIVGRKFAIFQKLHHIPRPSIRLSPIEKNGTGSVFDGGKKSYLVFKAYSGDFSSGVILFSIADQRLKRGISSALNIYHPINLSAAAAAEKSSNAPPDEQIAAAEMSVSLD